MVLSTYHPPISYMEMCRVFKPLATTGNPLGLCQFYYADPGNAMSVPAPTPLATVCHLKCLLVKAWEQVQPYVIVVFEGGNVMSLGLLQELHSWYALSHIPIFTPEEAKHVIKNDSTFLNHIVIGHYWCNFACSKCLDVVDTSGQQLKKHFLKCPGISDTSHKASSQGSGGASRGGSQSGDKCSTPCKGRESGPQSKDKHDKGEWGSHHR